MGMKLLKRLSSSRKSFKKDLSKELSPNNGAIDDTETSSDTSSNRTLLTPKGIELDALAQAGKFDKIVKLVAQSRLEDWVPENSILTSVAEQPVPPPTTTDASKWPVGVSTPLHLILAHKKAPVAVIEQVATLLRDQFSILVPEEFPDHLGRCPLHVAVQAGCDEEIATALLQGQTMIMPAYCLDAQKRTPLHWACLPIESKKRSRKVAMAQWHQKQVVNVLLENFPEATSIPDALGKTPLCYAKESTLASVVPRIEREYNESAPKTKPPLDDDTASPVALEDWLPEDVPGVPNDDDLSTIYDMDGP